MSLNPHAGYGSRAGASESATQRIYVHLCGVVFAVGACDLNMIRDTGADSLDSCQGRCGYGTDSSFSCQCNPSCERYNDCCSDYAEICKTSATSCKGRCGDGGGGGVITDAEIKAISEALYVLDSNKASASELIIDAQALVDNSQTSSQSDLSSRPLFRYVDEGALFSRPTYAAFLAVLDNYQR
ncbi:Poly(U)-specific endoribonuclease, partial [Nibea albiflora]